MFGFNIVSLMHINRHAIDTLRSNVKIRFLCQRIPLVMAYNNGLCKTYWILHRLAANRNNRIRPWPLTHFGSRSRYCRSPACLITFFYKSLNFNFYIIVKYATWLNYYTLLLGNVRLTFSCFTYWSRDVAYGILPIMKDPTRIFSIAQ